jgi:prepilin-type N-terminal cleavage/methylation domain-containing protein/prepilin-type processing-associated H-X9-DG protein
MDGTQGNNVRGAHGSAGFSLIELLVVIAVIVILVALLFPVLSKIKEKARTIKCLSNVKQWVYSFHIYSEDNDDYFPYEGNTTDAIDAGLNVEAWFNVAPPCMAVSALKDLYAVGNIPLRGDNSVFVCPSTAKPPTAPPSMTDPFFMYGFNNRMDPNGPDRFKRVQVVDPSDTVMFTESQGQLPWATYQTPARHTGRANLGFVDGRAETIPKKDYDRTSAEDDSDVEWAVGRRVYWFPFPGAPK